MLHQHWLTEGVTPGQQYHSGSSHTSHIVHIKYYLQKCKRGNAHRICYHTDKSSRYNYVQKFYSSTTQDHTDWMWPRRLALL